jgi:REP element-mobilizing transposase RayT
MSFRDRGYLPHLEVPGSTYFITFRLAGTLPQSVLLSIQAEMIALKSVAERTDRKLGALEENRLKYLESEKIEKYLDEGYGDCWLKLEDVAKLVNNSILYFDKTKYCSHAWCIMPNHLHWIITPKEKSLTEIIQGLKSFTAHQANKILNRDGPFWSREYYDHLIRSEEEFGRLIMYTIENPVKAGLCEKWDDWQWTGVSDEIRALL